MLMYVDASVELTVEQCWELLESNVFGRLAYRLVEVVHLVPVNYVVDNRSLLIRTGPSNKLLAAPLQSDVAFEIDWHDDSEAWSVVARVRLRRLAGGERRRAEKQSEWSCLTTPKDDVI